MTSNQEHAARLRQIAADLLGMDSDSADVPALLAGAEALERLEAMESTSSTMLPKSALESEEGR